MSPALPGDSRMRAMRRVAPALLLLFLACARPETAEGPAAQAKPSILLITLDTTRADAIGEATPRINEIAARGKRFRYAYATVPQTLPSHSSMFTGLYPAGHGVRENARFLDARHATVAEKLKSAGYGTAAFVSAFAVAKRFGIARGFDVYDEDFGAGAERDAKATTERALTYLQSAAANEPLFLWVHYYDPHYPYTPPAPHRGYRGEVAFMDEQLGRVVEAFARRGETAIVIAADHGEGLGEHGEQQHGNLLYQTTMHVPLIMAGPGVSVGTVDTPVSTRRIFHTLLDFAGIDATDSLRGTSGETVIVGEAMKPFLDYGWQPQVMTVEGTQKAIMAGRLEVYDVAADPKETRSLAAQANLSRPVRATLRDYPLPSARAAEPPANLDEEAQRKLASLGYVSATARPVVRKDAPVPADMAGLFPILDEAAALFVREQYAAAIPLLERIQKADPYNLDTALRLATAHSALGHEAKALQAFEKAEAIAPDSPDVRTYLALHLAKTKEWERAVPLLERITAEEPNRLPPLEALAVIRERQGRIAEAVSLRQKIYTMRAPGGGELLSLGQMQMALGQTAPAIATFERARTMLGSQFRNDLELGVLQLAAGNLDAAREALDRVPPSRPGYPMALFKRAQVSVLLRESDAAARIEKARQHADATTRVLIERERLFR
jgi:arylsulfatase A-like enzyme/tetratricopeptide (TPR) repeat protein